MAKPPAIPGPGWFKVRFVKKGPWVAAKLDIEDGICTVTVDGKEQAREDNHRWIAEIGDAVYPLGPRIDEPEYLQILAYVQWAQDHSPEDPVLSPRKPINLRTMGSLY